MTDPKRSSPGPLFSTVALLTAVMLVAFAPEVRAGVVTTGTFLGLLAQSLGASSVSGTAPTDEQVLSYEASTGELVWQADGGGTSLTGLGTDNRLARWDGTDTIQSSGVTLSDADAMTGVATVTATTRLAGPAGSATAASVGLDATDGFFFVDNTSVSTTVNGVEEQRLTATALDRGTDQIVFGSAIGTSDLGLVRDAAGRLRVSDGSTGTADLLASQVFITAASTSGWVIEGTSNTMTFKEGDDTDSASGDLFRFGGVTNGYGAVSASVDSPGNPVFTFNGDGNTGVGRVEADALAVAAEGQWRTIWSNSTTLPDNTATSIVTIPLASGAMVGGLLRVVYLVTDGTDHQVLSKTWGFSAVDKAGTLTSQAAQDFSGSVANSTGSITAESITIVDGTNAITLQATVNSSLTSPTITCRWWLDMSHSTAGVAVTIP